QRYWRYAPSRKTQGFAGELIVLSSQFLGYARNVGKGTKKGCPHDNQSSLLTLKSNTMKNTVQR
ncbi:MAG: hypothetical protein LBH32_13160, partial [Dysgonamonadaceae bacterium]|nr:hypothetical protein [Dysgonamonadaceae bacterium]